MKLWHVYIALAVIGFLGTGSQVLGYLDAGPVGGTADFWRDALSTNDAARFLAIDVLVLGVAVFVFLGVEACRVGITAKWFVFYVVGSLLVGISTFVPLFLAHRQRRLEATQTAHG
jgi:NO-binding membrane sensor protein with MHYT domain